MKSDKSAILTIGIIIGVLCTLGRLIVVGWLFLFGLISIAIFGIIHIFFLKQISKYYDQIPSGDKKLAWIGVLIYPFIFLFQFDFGDSAGSTYVYELLLGEDYSSFGSYAFLIVPFAAILYLIIVIIWDFRKRKIIANN